MRVFQRKILGLSLIAFVIACYAQTPAAFAKPGSLATISGAVVDSKGNPLAGALISLIKEGSSKVVKETRSDINGRFAARILPGRYGIHAIAKGFNEVVFSAVEVRASQELVYRFNLEPIGSGKTLVEQRRDRDDVKWTLRSAHTRKSIFQAQEGDDQAIQAVIAAETAQSAPTDDIGEPPVVDSASDPPQKHEQAVVEPYFPNSYG